MESSLYLIAVMHIYCSLQNLKSENQIVNSLFPCTNSINFQKEIKYKITENVGRGGDQKGK